MTLSERLLLALSRAPSASDYQTAKQSWSIDNALIPLFKNFPELRARMDGARVLDFGCGEGWQVLALSKLGTASAVGIDANTNTLERAQSLSREFQSEQQVKFGSHIEDSMIGTFDIVISQNSMEHFPEPLLALQEMKKCLAPSGAIYLSFGPPWFAPHGSHMFFFTHVPWINIIFSEKTVMNVRKFFRNDGAEHYEDVESGLNKMSLQKFESLVSQSGLRVRSREYRTVKSIPLVDRIPLIRELLVNYVSCVLTRS